MLQYNKETPPILITTFVRHETFQEVFLSIKKAKPKMLFIASDGPRENSSTDSENVRKCREIAEDINWDCEVHKLYSSVNLGLLRNTIESMKYAFSLVDELLFLEDDILPSDTFYKFTQELLQKYRYDERVHLICGMNHLGIYEDVNSDYFFSKTGSIWGLAIWKRSFDLFWNIYNINNSRYVNSLLKSNMPAFFYRKTRDRLTHVLNEGRDYKNDFELLALISMYLNNSTLIIPKMNLISCLGLAVNSTHSPKEVRKLIRPIRLLFNMKKYEINFPMNHPQFICDDNIYSKKVINILNGKNILIRLLRKIEYIIRRIIYYGK